MFKRVKKIIVGVVRELHKGRARSPAWRKVRRAHLEAYPACEACGSKRLLQVHHKAPFHGYPELELDPRNLITLCMWKLCHIDIGHGNDFKAYNPDVGADTRTVRASPERRPEIVAKAEKARQYLSHAPIAQLTERSD